MTIPVILFRVIDLTRPKSTKKTRIVFSGSKHYPACFFTAEKSYPAN